MMNKQIEEIIDAIEFQLIVANATKTPSIALPAKYGMFLLDLLRKQGEGEWISVDERLPESGVHCLLCCDIKCIDGTHRQYVCDGYHAERWKEECSNSDDDCAVEYNEEDDEYYLCEGWYEVIKNWDDYSSVAIADTITHWMPLPQPPNYNDKVEGAKTITIPKFTYKGGGSDDA